MIDLSGACWRKSSYSTNGGECIEIADGFVGAVPVRDSKNPHGPVLVFPAESFTAFVNGIRTGTIGLA
jgi:hypothetical protein